MKCVVLTHKLLWRVRGGNTEYATDGGFPRQMEALSKIFSKLVICAPVSGKDRDGGSALRGQSLGVVPLGPLETRGVARRITLVWWTIRNLPTIVREIVRADCVHTPIPGDVGTIGMVLAVLLRKPLLVRHCGNWDRRSTMAEVFWRWFIEFFAGGRNVMLLTGAKRAAPSDEEKGIQWIFSSSMWMSEMKQFGANARQNPSEEDLRIVIACRQSMEKRVDLVIRAAAKMVCEFPGLRLDIFGDGPDLSFFQRVAEREGIQSRVVFHGQVTPEELWGRMARSHVFCLPSASEGFPKAVLEAMACGLPVVVGSLPVFRAMTADGGGVAVEDPSPESVADAIRSVVKGGAYQEMARRAHETALLYSLDCWSERIAEILAERWGRYGFRAR